MFLQVPSEKDTLYLHLLFALKDPNVGTLESPPPQFSMPSVPYRYPVVCLKGVTFVVFVFFFLFYVSRGIKTGLNGKP